MFPLSDDPLEKELATRTSVLAWKIPWTEEPGGLQSMGSQRVRHDGACVCAHARTHTHRQSYSVLYYNGVNMTLHFVQTYRIYKNVYIHSMDCTVHGLFQAKILAWVAVPFSSGYSTPRNRTGVSCIGGGFLTR